jgi:hypothetical protein
VSRLLSESCHTSRMREICTSGSQEGRGVTVIGIRLSPRPPRLLDRLRVRLKPQISSLRPSGSSHDPHLELSSQNCPFSALKQEVFLFAPLPINELRRWSSKPGQLCGDIPEAAAVPRSKSTLNFPFSSPFWCNCSERTLRCNELQRLSPSPGEILHLLWFVAVLFPAFPLYACSYQTYAHLRAPILSLLFDIIIRMNR